MDKVSKQVLLRLGGKKRQTKAQRRFWVESLGGKLRCPKCGGIVTEHLQEDLVFYQCSKCSWNKQVDFEGSDG